MYVAELILTKDQITAEDWRKFVTIIGNHVKGLKPVSIQVVFLENIVHYYVISKHDVSALSSGIEGMMLRPVTANKFIATPEGAERIRFLKIPVGGSLFDLKERYKIQDGIELQAVTIDVQRFGKNRLAAKMTTLFSLGALHKVSKQQLKLFPAHLLAADYAVSQTYIKSAANKYVSLEKTAHVLNSDNLNALFSVDTFPYFAHDYFLNLTSYEFDKHSFIVGSSGSGKSKFIELYIDRLQQTALAMNYRVIVIDPHAALEADLVHIQGSKIVNFSGEGAKLFPEAGADISAATELTTTLFKSLLANQYNPRLERVLRFSLYVAFVAQSMSMQFLKTFLTDLDTRTQVLDHVKGYIPENVHKFFGADFNEIRTTYYNEAVLPIVSLVDELQLQPTLANDSQVSLLHTVQQNFLTVFSLNKVSMGEKVVKTVAGLLIQQIFLLAQSRAFGQRVILIIDEVSVIQSPALASILAEARKFDLSVILTQQYFGQIEKELRDAILSNVVNYYIFKVSEEDARSLEGNVVIEVPKELMALHKEKGHNEADLRAKYLTELSPRECLVRVSAAGQLLPCIKARTLDSPSYANQATNTMQAALVPVTAAPLPPKFQMGTTTPAPLASVSATAGGEGTWQPDAVARAMVADKPPSAVPALPKERKIQKLSDLFKSQSSSREKMDENKGGQPQ